MLNTTSPTIVFVAPNARPGHTLPSSSTSLQSRSPHGFVAAAARARVVLPRLARPRPRSRASTTTRRAVVVAFVARIVTGIVRRRVSARRGGETTRGSEGPVPKFDQRDSTTSHDPTKKTTSRTSRVHDTGNVSPYSRYSKSHRDHSVEEYVRMHP